jgi:isoamylase
MDWAADPAADNLSTVVRNLISLRSGVPALRAARFPEPGPAGSSEPVAGTGLGWFNPDGSPVTSQDWDNTEGRSFAVLFSGIAPAPSVLVMLNGYWEPITFTLPSPPSGTWTPNLDTSQEDGTPAARGPLGAGAPVIAGPRSIVIATG